MEDRGTAEIVFGGPTISIDEKSGKVYLLCRARGGIPLVSRVAIKPSRKRYQSHQAWAADNNTNGVSVAGVDVLSKEYFWACIWD